MDEGAIRDPLVAASIRRTIGAVYLGLGRADDADTLLRAALTERIARTGGELQDQRKLAKPALISALADVYALPSQGGAGAPAR